MICTLCGLYKSGFNKDSKFDKLRNLKQCNDCLAYVNNGYYKLVSHMMKCSKRHARENCYCPPPEEPKPFTFSNRSWVSEPNYVKCKCIRRNIDGEIN